MEVPRLAAQRRTGGVLMAKSKTKTLKMGLDGLVRLRGKTYKPSVMRIEDHYEDGRIKTLTMIHEDQTVSLEDPTQRNFMIVLAPTVMLEKAN